MALVKLNAAFESFSGKTGNAVFAATKDGTVFKNRPTKNDPKSPAQVAQRARMKKVTGIYKGFTAAQATTWNNYGATLPPRTNKAGDKIRPSGIQAFAKLGTKFLAVTPAGTVPTTPPATEFLGDTLTVTAAAATGKVTFTGSGGNANNVTTELLLQPLPSAARKPRSNAYRSQIFKVFATGSLNADVVAPAGYYSPAYRFVNTQTGQELAVVPLPVVKVL